MALVNSSKCERVLFFDCYGSSKQTVSFLSDSDSPYIYVGVGVFLLLLGVSTGIFNLLTLIVICKNDHLQSVPNIVIASLLTSDMFTGFIAEPLVLVIAVLSARKDINSANILVVVEVYITLYFVTVTYFTHTVVWMERYIGIFHPFFYRKWIVKTFVVKFLTGLWVLITLVTWIMLLTYNLNEMISVTLYTFPLAITWCIYVQLRTIILVRRIRAEIASLPVPHQEITERSTETHVFAASKATKVGISIFLHFIVCYTPYLVIEFLAHYNLVSYGKLVSHGLWAVFLVFFNSFCNVVIYSIRIKEIREAVLSFVRGLLRIN